MIRMCGFQAPSSHFIIAKTHKVNDRPRPCTSIDKNNRVLSWSFYDYIRFLSRELGHIIGRILNRSQYKHDLLFVVFFTSSHIIVGPYNIVIVKALIMYVQSHSTGNNWETNRCRTVTGV